MTTVASIAQFLDAFAPPELAESWDNVGLLAGDRQQSVSRLMTCLTLSRAVAEEAIAERAELVVTHHPLPFRPLKRLTCDTPEGWLLWNLLGARINVYSPHTAFDSAAAGINQQLAVGLGLLDIRPLVPAEGGPLGAGRWGKLAVPTTVGQFAESVKQFLDIDQLQSVGPSGRSLEAVAVACGSAGEFLEPARQAGCDCLLTGEARFHAALEAEANGMALLLAGHYASERFAVETLAEVLAVEFPDLKVWASRQERDPLEWL